MKNLNLTLITIVIFIYGFQCNKDDCDEYIYDTVSLEFAIVPLNYKYEIGDTIAISNLSGSQLLLNELQYTIDHSNGEISFYFDLFEVNSNNEAINSGTEDFEINHNGSQLDYVQNSNQITRLISWKCGDNNCPLEINLIPTKSGYYGIRLLHGIIKESSDCEEFEIRDSKFLAEDNNFENLTEINTTEINIEAEIEFSLIATSNGSYFFNVD